MKQEISLIAMEYAIKCHAETNHYYDKTKPYSVHLEMVVATASQFKNLIPEKDYDTIIAGCWVHDVIEDCRQSYNDVKQATNKEVAELAYALTNEKGKNREGRGSFNYYVEMKDVPNATFINICDRIANIEYSKASKSRMLNMYAKENDKFVYRAWDEKYAEMFDYLKSLLTTP